MKVLVIGNGAREHALVWKLAQSKEVAKIYCAPGNGGIKKLAECVNIKAEDIDKLLSFAIKESIDLTVVGPEAPLTMGIVDRFSQAGLKVFGPNKAASKLEGSKIYSKDFMKKYNIPTARYESFTDRESALKGLKDFQCPVVIKADGLAAGKGVLICSNHSEAQKVVNDMMSDKKFGEAGLSIVMEEFLDGIEASLLCFVSKNKIIPMESARDYKKIYEGDKGANTGGMGCFSPNTIFTDELLEDITSNILNNIENGFIKEKIEYSGVLFIGLMITKEGSKVLEFNVRFGDPEAEVVLVRLESDLTKIIDKTIKGTLEKSDLQWTSKKALCVIAASGGYPFNYEKDKIINGLDKTDKDIIIFHGGTKEDNGHIYTNGGRVIAVTAIGESLEEARKKVYKNIEKINFENMYYRSDIGKI